MKNNSKKVTIHTKLCIGFTIANIMCLIMCVLGVLTAKDMMTIKPENMLHHYQMYKLFAIGCEIIAFSCIMAATVYITRAIRLGLANVIKSVKFLSQGDVNQELIKDSEDEFGMIMDSLFELQENIKNNSNSMEAVADGDLTMKINPVGDKDVLGNALKDLVENNRSSLMGIEDAAYQVKVSSSQVAAASDSLAQGSTEQASAIEEINASIKDVAEKTKLNASQATEAAELVNTAIANVENGSEEMKAMLGAMQDINHSSESISKIIKVIDDIAFQTNILALNAAVEAARAGEAGKGFAVVAEEVRNLAAKSAKAASETAELIESSIQTVEKGSSLADETAKAMDEISEIVKKSEAIITEIAESSNYQATAVAQINQAIGQVSQVVQTNSATSEQCAVAAEDLSNQAARMEELLSVYKLGVAKRTSEPAKAMAPKVARASAQAVDVEAESNENIISLGDSFGKY